jgi:hypothetical protein
MNGDESPARIYEAAWLAAISSPAEGSDCT